MRIAILVVVATACAGGAARPKPPAVAAGTCCCRLVVDETLSPGTVETREEYELTAEAACRGECIELDRCATASCCCEYVVESNPIPGDGPGEPDRYEMDQQHERTTADACAATRSGYCVAMARCDPG